MKSLKFLIFITMIFCLGNFTATSQNSQWMVFAKANSFLPSNIVNSIVVDKQGVKWIASGSNLVRSVNQDGYIYPTPLEFGISELGQITIDQIGNKWIRTRESGLLKFGADSSWTQYSHSNGFPGDDKTTAVAVDSNGNIWVGSLGGLSKLHDTSWTQYSGKSYLPNDSVNAVIVDGNNNIWIATFDGLVKFDGTNWIRYDTTNFPLKSNYIISMAVDNKNNIYIGTKGGFAKFDGTNWTNQNPTINNDKLNNNVWSITVGKNYLWIGFKYDQDRISAKFDGFLWHFFGPDNSQLPKSDVQSIAVDDSNHVWFGTYLGGMVEYFDTGVYDDSLVVADFSATPRQGYAPLSVQFTDYSKGNITSWRWNFGDGDSSTEKNPSHIYADTGKYSVQLIVSDGYHIDTVFKQNYITVTEHNKTITLNSPQAGESLLAGSKYPIEWEASPEVTHVNLFYKTSLGGSWIPVASNQLTATGANYYIWNPVPNTLSTDCYMEAVDVSDQTVYDINGPFTIQSGTTVVTTEQLEVCSDPDWSGKVVKTSFKTDPNKKYRLTFYGTYRLFPRSTPCTNDGDVSCGFDAAYSYDVPLESIQSGDWPSSSDMKLPDWFGDTTEYYLSGSKMLRPSEHTGLRFNGKPLPNIGYNSGHSYVINDKPGTGDYFSFAIIDFIRNGSQNIPRYDGNRDCISIIIEEEKNVDIDYCGYELLYDLDSNVIGMQLKAGIFVQDTNSVTGKINLISRLAPDQLGLVANGKFICPIDSIVCDSAQTRTQAPVHIGLLVDKSSSMAGPISEKDSTVRITGLKAALNNFINNMRDEDTTFLMSFSDYISLDRDWTNNKDSLKTAVSGLVADGYTQLWGAMNKAIDKLELAKSPRILIVLSDGVNSEVPNWEDSKILERVSNLTDLPIYIIALGLSQDTTDKLGRQRMGELASASGGKVFDVDNSTNLNDVYQEINYNVTISECCRIYFHVPIDSCGWIKLIYSPSDTTTLSRVFYYCGSGNQAPPDTSGTNVTDDGSTFKMGVAPNPLDRNALLNYTLFKTGTVQIIITDLMGNKVENIDEGMQQEGNHSYVIDGSKLQSGTYITTVTLDGTALSRKIIVIH